MRDLNFEIKQICQRNHDGSFATRANRERMLSLAADQLDELGYRHLHVQSLKPKHIEALVERWKGESLTSGTIKNRMAELRWLSQKINKANIIARSNHVYGIERRVYVTNTSKAQRLEQPKLERVSDPLSAASLKLQEVFGLRKAESIKINPSLADRGDKLVLKASWCKGSRARVVPIRTEAQRQALNEAKRIAGGASLIPRDLRYVDQMRKFEYQCGRAGIDHVHGLRHAYAQTRYRELTGWMAPAAGGPTSRQLTPAQKALDREARLTISRELGHEREQITAVYLGR